MASEWTSAELSEEAFDDLDEAAQRKLDSWAFGIYEQEPTTTQVCDAKPTIST